MSSASAPRIRTSTSEKGSDSPDVAAQATKTPSTASPSLKDEKQHHDDVSSSVGGGVGGKFYTDEEERKLVRKIDLILLPTLTILYLLSFLDRSNIGNAKIDGMVVDLGLGNQYPTALTLFFVGVSIRRASAPGFQQLLT